MTRIFRRIAMLGITDIRPLVIKAFVVSARLVKHETVHHHPGQAVLVYLRLLNEAGPSHLELASVI